MKPGRFVFSVPRPYVSHDPIVGRPGCSFRSLLGHEHDGLALAHVLHADRVDAVAQPGRRRAVGEDVAQVPVAAPAGDLDADATFLVAGPEKTVTPAGAFDAFKVEQRVVVHAAPDVVTTTTLWLAPGVGLVKQVIETPDHKGEALLSAYNVPYNVHGGG